MLWVICELLAALELAPWHAIPGLHIFFSCCVMSCPSCLVVSCHAGLFNFASFWSVGLLFFYFCPKLFCCVALLYCVNILFSVGLLRTAMCLVFIICTINIMLGLVISAVFLLLRLINIHAPFNFREFYMTTEDFCYHGALFIKRNMTKTFYLRLQHSNKMYRIKPFIKEGNLDTVIYGAEYKFQSKIYNFESFHGTIFFSSLLF